LNSISAGKSGGGGIPKITRIAGEGELSFGVVHDDEVAHAGRCGATTQNILLENGGAQSFGRKGMGTRLRSRRR